MKFLQIICILCALLLLPLPAAAEDHKHSVKSWTVTDEPTCTEQGSKYGVCSICGRKVFRVIEATGHTFGDWTQCRENVRTRTCSVCGASEREYVFAPEKDLPLRIATEGTAQQIGFTFPEGYAGDMTLLLPAGPETELLFSVPGCLAEKRVPEETEAGHAVSLPAAAELKSVRLLIPERTELYALTVHVSEAAPESVTVFLPELGAPAEMLLSVFAGQRMTLTVTGQDAGKTSVKKAAAGLAATLISSDVIEIEYPEPVLSEAEAKQLFTVTVGGEPAEWEYLSCFDFGAYGERGGVISIRLVRALDVGQPAMFAGDACITPSSQEENGPAAAATVCVSCGEESAEAVFVPFWSEIRYLEETGAAVWVAAGAESAELPGEEKSLTVHLLGPAQSVYEDPACRGLYVPGKTRDTFSLTSLCGADGASVTVRGT